MTIRNDQSIYIADFLAKGAFKRRFTSCSLSIGKNVDVGIIRHGKHFNLFLSIDGKMQSDKNKFTATISKQELSTLITELINNCEAIRNVSFEMQQNNSASIPESLIKNTSATTSTSKQVPQKSPEINESEYEDYIPVRKEDITNENETKINRDISNATSPKSQNKVPFSFLFKKKKQNVPEIPENEHISDAELTQMDIVDAPETISEESTLEEALEEISLDIIEEDPLSDEYSEVLEEEELPLDDEVDPLSETTADVPLSDNPENMKSVNGEYEVNESTDQSDIAAEGEFVDDNEDRVEELGCNEEEIIPIDEPLKDNMNTGTEDILGKSIGEAVNAVVKEVTDNQVTDYDNESYDSYDNVGKFNEQRSVDIMESNKENLNDNEPKQMPAVSQEETVKAIIPVDDSDNKGSVSEKSYLFHSLENDSSIRENMRVLNDKMFDFDMELGISFYIRTITALLPAYHNDIDAMASDTGIDTRDIILALYERNLI